MRVTTIMLTSTALYDLDNLREKYAKAQSSVNGRVLERPSEDPQRVVEAMDLSGIKLRLDRARRSGQDAREWLTIAENGVSALIDQIQAAREVAVQSGSPSGLNVDAREGLAQNIEAIRDAMLREMNGQHRDQYIFSGWKTTTKPFDNDGNGGVTYVSGSNGEITRDVAPGLAVAVNVPGDRLLADGDFTKTLSDIAQNLRNGALDQISTTRIVELDKALSNLTTIRSDLGIRQVQIEQYMTYAQESLVQIENRLTEITGADLESAVLKMTEAQNAYQAAVASFAKALPTSLIDYMLR